MLFYYNMFKLLGIISKLYSIQGTSTINAITIGKSIVQQNDINWSYLILGNEALTHINVKIIKQLFNPNVKLYSKPCIKGFCNMYELSNQFV